MKFLGGVVCSFLFAVAALGGQIQGRVTNAQGTAVPGAKVTVTHPGNAARWEATTAADGSYAVAGLESGSYRITVAGPPGQGSLQREVVLGAGGAEARADFQFPPTAAPALAASVAEERNPNIFIYRIDLNDLRNQLTIARGPNPQYLPTLKAEQNYFGAEYGTPLLQFDLISSRSLARSWQGSVVAQHQNSALNARNFFNVGPLRGSRTTTYNVTASGPLASDQASALLDFGQLFNSGMVNGNVQVPTASERAPQSSDPQVNAVIAKLLQAYPAELPNLPAVSLRQLNTNAPRDIRTATGLARLDLKPGEDTAAAFRYSINDYREDPFQLVVGQNPQTDLRTQAAHASLTRTFSPQMVGRFGFHFDRVKALLLPTQQFDNLLSSLGYGNVPNIQFSPNNNTQTELYNLGPGTIFPRQRFQNRMELYSDLTRTVGRHTLKAGGSLTRVQVNDLQSYNSRGALSFSPDFGRTGVQNFLLGTPVSFSITLGNLYRGFRNWEHGLFLQDDFRVTPTFSLNWGARYDLETAPTEVNRLTTVAFPTDRNNLAPRFGLAWNPGRGKTVIRGAYGISYSFIFPVTYQVTRFNPPAVQVLQVDAPSLLDALALANRPESVQAQPGSRSSLWTLSPDLVTPYSHQYNLAVERTLPWASTLRLAYMGSRSFHLLRQGVYNRAAPILPDPNRTRNTSRNVNDRRPDSRYFDINVIESNSNDYYDALQLSWDKRLTHGLAFRAAYTFSKDINTGGDFTNTASGVEVPPETGMPSCETCDVVSDQKGVALYDTPHVLLLTYSYNLPFAAGLNGWKSALLRGWQISGTTTLQSGLPFHLHTGSDAPGIGNVDGASQDRPNILNPSILGKSVDNPDTSSQILERSYFDHNVVPGGRGNLGWNTFRKDGTQNWNFAVGRTFRLPGGAERSLQFRGEFINLSNHPAFDKPGVLTAVATFGKIINTVNKGRQVQFSLRLNF